MGSGAPSREGTASLPRQGRQVAHPGTPTGDCRGSPRCGLSAYRAPVTHLPRSQAPVDPTDLPGRRGGRPASAGSPEKSRARQPPTPARFPFVGSGFFGVAEDPEARVGADADGVAVVLPEFPGRRPRSRLVRPRAEAVFSWREGAPCSSTEAIARRANAGKSLLAFRPSRPSRPVPTPCSRQVASGWRAGEESEGIRMASGLVSPGPTGCFRRMVTVAGGPVPWGAAAPPEAGRDRCPLRRRGSREEPPAHRPFSG